MAFRNGSTITKAVAVLAVLLLPFSASFAQAPADLPPGTPGPQQAAPLLPPEQLDNLVAPVALYPDPLLSQVLAASTYPLEIVEASQWLQQNSNLQGAQLMEAAKQQNWDPSVQALVAFPDAFRLLSNDVRWTTDLGNAFLAQQADVMSAIQRMRARARANGRLATTPQQVVTTENQDGQSAIDIQPANPQVVYVPVYNPVYVWGAPDYGFYPDLWYPAGFGFGFGFGPGIFMGGFFPGWGGWGGWGWGCGWFGHGLFLNTGFFNRWGFHGGYYGRGFGGFAGRGSVGRLAWSHDPGHRMGVPYPNRAVASRFNSNRFAGGGMNRGSAMANRGGAGVAGNGLRSSSAGGWQHFNGQPTSRGSASPGSTARSYAAPRQGSAGASPRQSYSAPRSYAAPRQSYSAPRSYAAPRQSYSAPRSYAAPRQSYSAPRSYAAPRQSYSAPRSYAAPRQSYSAPRSSGGGFSGGHAGSSGGHSGGGGGGGHRR